MVVMGIVAVMFAGACWFFRSCRGNKAGRNKDVRDEQDGGAELCMQCAQRMHDKKAAYRLIYDETLNDLVMMCPRCGRRHAKIARREAPK